MELRLSLFLSKASVASRRGADELIERGNVTVNGQVVTDPGKRIHVGKDHVKVDGKLITKLAPPVYLMLNKPPGCVTTTNDPEGRTTVFEFLKRVKVMVEPVGRLDYDTEGILLFTNDGEMANKLMSPKHKVPKTYSAKVKGAPSPDSLQMLRSGVMLDGQKTLPAKVKRIKKTDAYSWVRITIVEGKYRQVRRMFEKVGHPVVRLRREKFGPLEMEGLAPGKFRYLNEYEIGRLRKGLQ
jgi:23S rRNA pseudouridine2605 synthase